MKSINFKTLLLLLLLVLGVGCKAGPGDKFVINYEDNLSLSYQEAGESSYQSKALGDAGARLYLTNKPELQSFAYAVEFSENDNGYYFAVKPGMAWCNLIPYLKEQHPEKTDEELETEAKKLATNHQEESSYSLGIISETIVGSNRLYTIPVEANRIEFRGKIKNILFAPENKDPVDMMPFLKETVRDDQCDAIKHRMNQVVTESPGASIELELIKI